jgi:AAA+ superfamily predicted ATPase
LNASNMALRDKLVGETDTKEMLDDNMRVLGRRVNDLEIDLNDKKDRIKVMRNQNEELQVKLDSIYEEQAASRQNLEKQMMNALEMKDQDIRRLQSERQNI